MDKKQLRSFGLMVGAIFATIGLLPVVFGGRDPRWWAMVCAIVLVGPATVYPEMLRPIHKAWMKLAEVLGWLNTRLILGLIFFFVVTPMGVLRRWLGKDAMGKDFMRDAQTYRIPRAPRPASHLKRQY